MTIAIAGLRACYLAVALCVGVAHPPRPPAIEIIPGSAFACGWTADGRRAYCAGLLDRGRVVVVASGKLAAIPHEYIHYLVRRRRLWTKDDPTDGAHAGPWWTCERREAVPACDGLWAAP